MRRTAPALAVALALAGAGPAGQGAIDPVSAVAQAERGPEQQPPARTQTAPPESETDRGGADGGPPIWAGIGLMLLAAAAGTVAARARNRRRMRDFSGR